MSEEIMSWDDCIDLLADIEDDLTEDLALELLEG